MTREDVEEFVNPIWKYVAIASLSFLFGAAIPSYINFVLLRDSVTRTDLNNAMQGLNSKFDGFNLRLSTDEQSIGMMKQWITDHDDGRGK